MKVFTRIQIGLARIVGNVLTERTELFGTSDEVVECLRLPKGTGLTDRTIDPDRGKVLPRIALDFHFDGGELNQHMNMIRHHNKIPPFISLSVKM